MFSRLVVLFDACVLYPAPVRDLVLRLAVADFYRAKWTDQIHDEWIWNLSHKRPDLNREKLETMRAKINASVEDCLVEGYESIAKTLQLPDPNDAMFWPQRSKPKLKLLLPIT